MFVLWIMVMLIACAMKALRKGGKPFAESSYCFLRHILSFILHNWLQALKCLFFLLSWNTWKKDLESSFAGVGKWDYCKFLHSHKGKGCFNLLFSLSHVNNKMQPMQLGGWLQANFMALQQVNSVAIFQITHRLKLWQQMW